MSSLRCLTSPALICFRRTSSFFLSASYPCELLKLSPSLTLSSAFQCPEKFQKTLMWIQVIALKASVSLPSCPSLSSSHFVMSPPSPVSRFNHERSTAALKLSTHPHSSPYSQSSLFKFFSTETVHSSPSPSMMSILEQKKKDILHDQTIEGRYATSLWKACEKEKKIEKVYHDITAINDIIKSNEDIKIFLAIPGISIEKKKIIWRDIKKKFQFDDLTLNFVFVLLDNRRLDRFVPIANAFINIYRVFANEIVCHVTTAKSLTSQEKKLILEALQQRAGASSKLIVEYAVSPSIMGGLLVRMGEQVLDFSVASRLERTRAQLLEPI